MAADLDGNGAIAGGAGQLSQLKLVMLVWK